MPDHFNEYQLSLVARIFEKKEEYNRHLKNLQQTRQAMINTMNLNAENRQLFIEQYHTLDELITIMSPTDSSASPFYIKN